MVKKVGDNWDCQLKQWCLDVAVAHNKRGAQSNKILKDAQKFYEWLAPPEKAKVISLVDINNNTEGTNPS